VGVVQESVTDRIGERRLADVIVVLGRGQLAGDDGRPGAIAILEDLEQIAPLLVLERGEGEVIEEQHVGARELGEEADVAAIGAGEGQLVEEAGGARR
jgi:hypothetical protein